LIGKNSIDFGSIL